MVLTLAAPHCGPCGELGSFPQYLGPPIPPVPFSTISRGLLRVEAYRVISRGFLPRSGSVMEFIRVKDWNVVDKGYERRAKFDGMRHHAGQILGYVGTVDAT